MCIKPKPKESFPKKKTGARKILSLVLTIVLVASFFPAATISASAASWTYEAPKDDSWKGGKTGADEANAIVITSEQQLAYMAYVINNGSGLNREAGLYYKLGADLDLSGRNWTAIGSNGTLSWFRGTFDGDGHVISGLTINNTTKEQGLFSNVALEETTVKNLRLTDVNISGGESVGGIAGYLGRATIENCYVSGTIKGSGKYVGGIAGESYDATVINCFNQAQITGGQDVGGVIGGALGSASGSITNCYNSGTIRGSQDVGGIAGWSAAVISDCHNTGGVTVTGNFAGGIVGVNAISDSVVVQRCSNSAAISGSSTVGGIFGTALGNSAVSDCYNTGNISATTGFAGGITGGIGTSISAPLIANCYSTGTVSAGSGSAAGIAGMFDAGTISNCVALNSSIATSSSLAGRIASNGFGRGDFIDNSALSTMLVKENVVTSANTATQYNGADVEPGTPLATVFSGWDTSVWNIPAGTLSPDGPLPTLKSEGDKPTTPPIALTAGLFTVDVQDVPYTGAKITKTITSDLTLDQDYTVAYANNTNVGTATITITGIGDYTGTLTYSFKITNAQELVSISIGSSIPTKTVYEHGDVFETAGLTVTATFANGDTLDITNAVDVIYDNDDALRAGDTFVTLSYSNGGVTMTCTVSGLTVNKKVLDVSGATWDYDTPFTYDGRAKTVTLVGLPEGIAVTYHENSKTAAGRYLAEAIIALSSGYSSDYYEITGTVDTLAWEIEKAPYDGELPALRYEIVSESDGETTVRIREVSGAEYSFDGDQFSDITSITVDETATVSLYIRIAESENYLASATVRQIIDLSKEEQAAPEAFTLIVEADGDVSYTVTIPEVENAEYSFDGVNYSDAVDANILTDCAPGTTITGFVRLPGTDTHNPSPATSSSVVLPIFQVETPVATPDGGSFTSSQSVTLSSATQGATIYYTLDERTPSTASLEYDGAFILTSTTTVKAIAVKEGMSDSEVLSVKFTKSSGSGSNSGGSKSTTNQPTVKDESETATDEKDPDTSAVSSNPFTDIKQTDWFYEAVVYAYENGIMQGTGAGAFEPQTKLSRAMLVQVLYNLENQPSAGAAGFTDVAADAWYAKAIAWAANHGVVNGLDNGYFGPNNEITREQMAVMLHNYCAYKNIELPVDDGSGSFTDAEAISDWAATAVSAMSQAGILSGKGNGLFDPQGTATRAEVAQMMMNFLEVIK